VDQLVLIYLNKNLVGRTFWYIW